MNIPVIVDVAIGLIFIYLIFSLLASEILELIATVLQWRAQHLRQSIINLLAGDTITDQNIEAAKRLTKDLYNHPLLNDLNQEARGLFSTFFRKITWFFSWIYQNITGGEIVFGNKVTAPSYIPGETFATALIERLGVSKLVETLIEAKFNQFIKSITDNIDIILERSDAPLQKEALEAGLESISSESYEALKVDLDKIRQEFSNHQLTLISAIDKISLKIDQFINRLENNDQKQLAEQKERLKIWKQTLFGKQNELAIVNGGLKPTFEEVADLVNLSARTCQDFQTYYEQRKKKVAQELQNFLLAFHSTIIIIINPELKEEEFPELKKFLSPSESSSIWADDSTKSEPKIAISLTYVDEKVVGIINEIINNDNLGKYPNARNYLKAFKEGFGEEGRKLLGSKFLLGSKLGLRWSKNNWCWRISVGVGLLFALVLFFVLFCLPGLFITPMGGILSALFILCLFIVFLLLNSEPKTKEWDDRESLSTVLDVYFSPFLDIVKFREDFKKKINNKNLKSDKSRLQWELSRLGQSFRQYHRALVLNNADVDLPFIPSSVKQSVASLVRRAKTKIDRTGNEVDHLREEIEIWFDRSMDRSSGVYQRNVRGIAILIGFLLAVVTNTNSIYILNRLAHDQELRQVVEKSAEQFIQGSQPSPSAPPISLSEKELRERNQIVSQLLNEQLTLPIGWNPRILGRQFGYEFPQNARDDDWEKLFDKYICKQAKNRDETKENTCLNFDDTYELVARDNLNKNDSSENIYKKAQKKYKEERKSNKPKHYFIPTAILVMMLTSGKWYIGLLFLVGWLVTAIAISMGASFWFDLLGKLINVRNTGNRPPSSANQTSVNSEKSS